MQEIEITERQEWPGPFLLSDNDKSNVQEAEDYVSTAIDSIVFGWQYDDADWRRVNQPRLNEDQLAAFAIWVVDGQIENGGITQVFYNSFGEMAEDALQGFKHFELYDFANILENAFDKFARPVPRRRQERWDLLGNMFEIPLGTIQYAEEGNNFWTKSSAYFEHLDEEYFALLAKYGGNMLLPLAKIIDKRKENFFRTA